MCQLLVDCWGDWRCDSVTPPSHEPASYQWPIAKGVAAQVLVLSDCPGGSVCRYRPWGACGQPISVGCQVHVGSCNAVIRSCGALSAHVIWRDFLLSFPHWWETGRPLSRLCLRGVVQLSHGVCDLHSESCWMLRCCCAPYLVRSWSVSAAAV